MWLERPREPARQPHRHPAVTPSAQQSRGTPGRLRSGRAARVGVGAQGAPGRGLLGLQASPKARGTERQPAKPLPATEPAGEAGGRLRCDVLLRATGLLWVLRSHSCASSRVGGERAPKWTEVGDRLCSDR